MKDFYHQLNELIHQGHTVAVATIVKTLGSVPREVGAKMIIHPEGRHLGTVGGGCGEAEVIRAALDVIQDREAAITQVDLTADISLEGDGLCGGTMHVLVEPWPPAGEVTALWEAHLATLVESEAKGEPVALVTSLPPAPFQRAVLLPDGSTVGTISEDVLTSARAKYGEGQRGTFLGAAGEYWFMDVLRTPPTLLIVGGGHIAMPLAAMARLLDMHVVIIDDRRRFANSERFPWADEIICDLYDKTLREYDIDADTYIVIVTRGHQHDLISLRAVLDSPAAYIGMIGSRRRVNGVFALLEKEEGIAPETLRRVYSPIGLEIGARTPAEIAVSIIAEVINVFRHGRAPSFSDYRRRA